MPDLGSNANARAPALTERAADLAGRGRLDGAEELARRALDWDRAHAPAHVVLGRVLRERGRLDEAVACGRRAARLDPSLPAAHGGLGASLRAQDRMVEAARALERAVRLDPDDPQLHTLLGNTLSDAGALEEALAHFAAAARLAPDDTMALSNLAVVHQRMGRFADADALYRRALTQEPDEPVTRFNRSFALLGLGDLAAGWVEQDEGFAAGLRGPDRRFAVPRWDGSDLGDRTLFVWREQGVGDELRFASCYPDVIARAGHVILEAEPRLAPLFARSFPAATVVASDPAAERRGSEPAVETTPPGVDIECPAGSLPRFLRRSLTDFPDHDGYLRAHPSAVAAFRERLAGLSAGPAVGICWRSMRLESARLRHYTALEEWDPVLRVPDVTFVNLQYGEKQVLEAELGGVRDRTGAQVHRLVDETGDLDGVAALLCALDLVVSVNTSVAAMAGGLGRPVVMLGVAEDPMRFGTDRYPWFPSLRFLARRWDEPWSRCVREAAAAVSDLVTDGSPGA